MTDSDKVFIMRMLLMGYPFLGFKKRRHPYKGAECTFMEFFYNNKTRLCSDGKRTYIYYQYGSKSNNEFYYMGDIPITLLSRKKDLRGYMETWL